jgi:lipoprotein signal peptidase
VRWPWRYSLLLFVAGIVVLLDQITKVWVDRTIRVYDFF